MHIGLLTTGGPVQRPAGGFKLMAVTTARLYGDQSGLQGLKQERHYSLTEFSVYEGIFVEIQYT
jgi:hypothetical protein